MTKMHQPRIKFNQYVNQLSFFLNKFEEERKVKSQTSIVWTFKFFSQAFFFLVFLARIIHD